MSSRRCSASSSAILSNSSLLSSGWSGADKQRRGRSPDRGERRLELVRHGVDERGSQLLALPCRFDLVREFLCPCPLQSDGDEVGDPLQDGIRHPGTLQREARDRLRAQANSCDDAIPLRIGERRSMQGRIAKLIVQTLEVRRARSIRTRPCAGHTGPPRSAGRSPPVSRPVVWQTARCCRSGESRG